MMKKISKLLLVLLLVAGVTTFVKATTSNEEYPYEMESTSLDKRAWEAIADSYHSNSIEGDGPASNLIDGSISTRWHGAYNSSSSLKGDHTYPHYVIFDLGKEESFNSFAWTKRIDSNNGRISRYAFFINSSSSDLALDSVPQKEESGWNTENTGWTLVSEGTLNYNGNVAKVDLGSTYTAKQVLFVAVEPDRNYNYITGDYHYATGAEFDLYGDIQVRAPLSNENMSLYVSGTTTTSLGGNNASTTDSNLLKGILFDNNKETYWQSKPKGVTSNKVADYGLLDTTTSYIIVDLGSLKYVDRVDLYKRYAAGFGNNGYGNETGDKAVVGNMLDAYVAISSDSEVDSASWTTVFNGKWPDNNQMDGELSVSFAPNFIRYIKISATQTAHWDAPQVDKIFGLSEIKVYGLNNFNTDVKNIALAENNPNMDNNGKGLSIGTGKGTLRAGISDGRPLKKLNDKTLTGNAANFCDVHAINDSGAPYKGSVYYQMDLGELAVIDSVKLYRHPGHTYGPTIIMVSRTTDFANPKIIYNSDENGEMHGFGAGTDREIQITSEGTTCDPSEPVIGRYVRVYGCGITNDSSADLHLYELEVNGYLANDALVMSDTIYSETPITDGYVRESTYIYDSGLDLCLPNELNAYTKYVTSSVLSVKAQSELIDYSETERRVNVRFVSSVPSANLDKLKFIVEVLDENGEVSRTATINTTKVYKEIASKNEGKVYFQSPKDIFDNEASKYFFIGKLNNIPISDPNLKIRVTPCWQSYGYDELGQENFTVGEYREFTVEEFVNNTAKVISEGE